MILFMYGVDSGSLPSNDEAKELLALADKYQIAPLKEISEEHLSKNLSMETLIEMTIIADRHTAAELMKVKYWRFNMENYSAF